MGVGVRTHVNSWPVKILMTVAIGIDTICGVSEMGSNAGSAVPSRLYGTNSVKIAISSQSFSIVVGINKS